MLSIIGIYDRTIIRNEKNGYTAFSLITKEHDEYKTKNGCLICVGKIPVFTSKMPLRISGEIKYKNNEYYLQVISIEEYSDKVENSVAYLSSSLFDGIGVKTAEKIIGVTGPDIFSFIKAPNAQQILADSIPELNDKRIKEIIRIIRNTINQKMLYEYIHPFGGEYSHAAKMCSIYGANAIERLKNNCYETGIAAGLPFIVCDSIAKSEGKSPYAEDRISAIVVCALQYFASCGSVYAVIEDIYRIANYLAAHSAFLEPIPKGLLIRSAFKTKKVVIESGDEPRYYLSDLWTAESKIVQEARRIQNSSQPLDFNNHVVNNIEKKCAIRYSEKQRKSFDFLKSTGIKILTGGPGTGKTTTVNGLIEAYKIMHPNNSILLCAPTGRAAQRMTESTGLPASTIHRLLDFKPYSNEITCKDQTNPLLADLLIVDEVSMADEIIFSLLMGAVKNNTLVILCGDVDQLPSVGPGNVLCDLISSQLFEVNELDVVYRQTNGSRIICNAQSINKGNHELRLGDDFNIIEVGTEKEIHDKIVDLVSSYYDSRDPYKIQVLSSTKKGDAGTIKLNEALQNICNGGYDTERKVGYGTSQYRVGDKVIMTKNNYEVGYVNGDIGIVSDISPDGMVVDIGGEEINISKGLLNDVSLSYAMTIHKSQGSEYPVVIISLPQNPSIMLKRNLIYTAVTRAKKRVIIVTQHGTIDKAIDCIDNSMRKTMLKEKLNGFEQTLIEAL